MNRFFSIMCLIIPHLCTAQVLIITHNYNRPDFIEMQQRSFKALLQDDHEYVVFNDATNPTFKAQITATCERLDIRCIDVPQHIHVASRAMNDRHAECVNYSLDVLGFDHEGIVLILDSDMFLTRPLNITQYMQNLDIVAFMKGTTPNIEYICPALCFLDMSKLPDKKTMRFNCIKEGGISADSGGKSYYYLQKHPELRLEYATSAWSYNLFLGNSDIHDPVDHTTPDAVKIEHYKKLGFHDYEINFFLKKPDTFEFFFSLNFIHYHAGSNHDSKAAAYHARKSQLFNELIDDAIAASQATA